MTSPLPESLRYLDQFIGYLQTLPADAINEDVDPQLLEQALRSRIATGDPHAILAADAESLDAWLASFDSDQHPAHWIAGYLTYVTPEDLDPSIPAAPPELIDQEVERLVDQIESAANKLLLDAAGPPAIQVQAPTGWAAVASPGSMRLTRGPSWAVITVIDRSFYQMMQQQHAATAETTQPLTCGGNSGFKFHYGSPEMASLKDYLLEVDGGYVRIRLSHDASDDQQQLESCFATLRIAPPGESTP